jgi:hypothetical protein
MYAQGGAGRTAHEEGYSREFLLKSLESLLTWAIVSFPGMGGNKLILLPDEFVFITLP